MSPHMHMHSDYDKCEDYNCDNNNNCYGCFHCFYLVLAAMPYMHADFQSQIMAKFSQRDVLYVNYFSYYISFKFR